MAPAIEDDLSQKYDFEIARTRVKVRNIHNPPDIWEKDESHSKLGAVCLTCHGDNIAVAIQANLK